MTLRTLNYGNYGIFLIMGNARFCPSTVAIGAAASETLSRSPCTDRCRLLFRPLEVFLELANYGEIEEPRCQDPLHRLSRLRLGAKRFERFSIFLGLVKAYLERF